MTIPIEEISTPHCADSGGASAYRQFVKPRLAESLALMGLDISYHRAQGHHAYTRDEHGREVQVLDMIGGNGSLLFGHNHPAIIADLRDAFESQRVVHAQLAIRDEAGLLARMLSDVASRETGLAEGFVVHLGNSGAEVVECALKHAEVTRMSKLVQVWDVVQAQLEELRRAVRSGQVRVSNAQLKHPTIESQFGRMTSLEELIEAVLAYDRGQLAKQPIFVALEQAFHGRLVASVQLTHAASPPYRNLGMNVRFVPLNRREALDRLSAQCQADTIDLYGLRVVGGELCLSKHAASRIAGVLVEPIQGEAGVLEVSREFGAALRCFADAQGCPLILDEIQSGMGRTGQFFASSGIGLTGDYYVLSKSLGGGVAKIGAILIRASLYQQDFALHHSSTFAEDDLSSLVARRVLKLLEENQGSTYQHIVKMGLRLRAAMDRLRDAFPEIIKEVRGRGLFLGVEFFPPLEACSPLLRNLTRNNLFGYLLAGYLLKSHRIRVAPTGSAPNLLRFHPSIQIDDVAIDRIESALRCLCEVLRHEDVLHLVFPLTKSVRRKPRTEIRDFRCRKGSPLESAPAPPSTQSAGVTKSRPDLNAIRTAEPALAELTDGELGTFASRLTVIDRRVGSLQHRRI